VLFTFYIQGVLKLKKNNSGAKRLMTDREISKYLKKNLSATFSTKNLTWIAMEGKSAFLGRSQVIAA